MIFIITRSDRGYRKWFYKDGMMEKWGELVMFFKDKHIVDWFKSDTLLPQDFLKIRIHERN